MQWIVLLTLLVSLGHCQDPDCPNPVECLANPCETEICPRFLNARCEVDNCNGECRALFFHRNSDQLLSAQNCSVTTCATRRECPERRTCVEEVFPPNCMPDEPRCRQYLRAVCELPRPPPPPSDCSVVQCGPGMVCDIFERRRGSEARCVPFRPSSCEELGPCDPGMECHFRDRGDRHSVVRCVPLRPEPRPSDCSQLECMIGFRCELFGRPDLRQRARCVRDRPPPTTQTCEELNCEETGMVCVQRGRRNVCRAPENCNEVVCGDDRVCSIFSIASDIPTEFRCPFNAARCKIEVINRLEDGRQLTCRDRALSFEPCSEVDCPDDKVCGGKIFAERSDVFVSTCVPKEQLSAVPPITNCESVPDDFCDENNACVDLEQDGYRGFAHCSEINCNNNPCTSEGDTCVESSARLLEESGISHSCAPVNRTMLELDTTCAGGRTPCPQNKTCTEARINGVLVGSLCTGPFQLPPRQCGEISCEDGEECVLDVVAAQVVRASCVQSRFLRELLPAVREVLENA